MNRQLAGIVLTAGEILTIPVAIFAWYADLHGLEPFILPWQTWASGLVVLAVVFFITDKLRMQAELHQRQRPRLRLLNHRELIQQHPDLPIMRDDDNVDTFMWADPPRLPTKAAFWIRNAGDRPAVNLSAAIEQQIASLPDIPAGITHGVGSLAYDDGNQYTIFIVSPNRRFKWFGRLEGKVCVSYEDPNGNIYQTGRKILLGNFEWEPNHGT